jgi:hypothetical protein
VDKVIDDPANQVIVLCKSALRGREKLALHWVNNGDTHRVWNQNKKGLQFRVWNQNKKGLQFRVWNQNKKGLQFRVWNQNKKGLQFRVWNQNKKGLQFKSTELPQGSIVSSDVSAVTVPETLNIALRFERHTSDTAVTITFGFAEEQVASANA